MALPRVVIGVVTAALLAGTTLAVAQSSGTKKPLGTMTCEDFLAWRRMQGIVRPATPPRAHRRRPSP